jgi:cytochrome P450 family 110
MTTWREFHFAFRTLPFLDSRVHDRVGMLELRARPTRRLLIWHPEGIDWIFRVDQKLDHVPSRTLSPLLGQESPLWTDGPRHTAYRRVLAPRLHGHHLQVWRPLIADTVHAALKTLVSGTAVSLIEWTKRVTLGVISQIVLHRADDLLLDTLTTCIDSVLNSRTRTLASRYLDRRAPSARRQALFPRDCRELGDILLTSLESAMNTQPLALAVLLADDRSLGALDNRQMVNQIMSLLFAGYETTASATAWTLFWLTCEDQVRRDTSAELTATSHDGSDPTKVPLLHAVVQEALRLSPPAIIAGKRRLTSDAELLGTPLTAGTVVTPCIYLAHRQSDPFSHPLQFNHVRFLDNKFSSRHYFPFGGGTRRCLGYELALMEIRMITAAVLRYCDIHCINPNSTIFKVRGPVLAPAHRLRISLSPHRLPRRS